MRESFRLELGMHNCKSFIIASDHGASRLAVIKKQEVPYEKDTKGEHSGRCCKSFDGCTAPTYTSDSLHAAVVEIYVKKNALILAAVFILQDYPITVNCAQLKIQ